MRITWTEHENGTMVRKVIIDDGHPAKGTVSFEKPGIIILERNYSKHPSLKFDIIVKGCVLKFGELSIELEPRLYSFEDIEIKPFKDLIAKFDTIDFKALKPADVKNAKDIIQKMKDLNYFIQNGALQVTKDQTSNLASLETTIYKNLTKIAGLHEAPTEHHGGSYLNHLPEDILGLVGKSLGLDGIKFPTAEE